MDILKKNLESLPILKKAFSQYKEDLYQPEKSKNDLWTLKINDIYINSKYDPLKEAARTIDIIAKDQEEFDIIVLYGNGLGYMGRILYDTLLKNNSSSIKPYIVYVEKDIKLFFTSLKYFDWSDILKSENFKIFIDAEKEKIGSFIQSVPTKKIRYYYHRPSMAFHEEYYKEVQNYIHYVIDRKDTNIATFSRFQKLWTKNFIYNLPCYIQSNAIKELRDRAMGTTSIIVAGGPTLEKYVNFLKNMNDDAVIIAVDTVYKYLKKQSIKPDILVTIDPQFWNYKYLENEKITDTIIVTDSSVYPKIMKLSSPDNYFMGSSIFPIVQYFDDENEKKGTLAAGGSVATTAFDTARIIGSDNIILIGLDLSFPGRMTHFKGAFFETNFLTFCEYFNTAESASYNYLVHTPLQIIKSTNGNVYTDFKMNLFKKWFDREIPITNAKVFQPDSGGAYLEGALITALDKMPEPDKEAKLVYKKNIKSIQKINDKNPFENINNKIKKILNNTEKIKKNTKKIVDMIPENGLIKNENCCKIEELEKSLMQSGETAEIVRIVSSSAQDILLSIMENQEFNDDKKSSVWIKTRFLYDSIYKLTNFYEKTLNKLLKVYKNNDENICKQ